VILLVDSHYDRRSAYYFMVNALGTQTDGRIVDDGRTSDLTWDAAWQAASQTTPYGWVVEMAIPYRSIKYAAGDSVAWGVNFGRSRRRTLETSFWAGPLDHRFRVSQAGILMGLNYGLSRLQENGSDDWEAGLDMRYALSPEMAAYVSINPDFATIEADQEEVNLTRFEVALQEKRPFFLEGNEFFRQRIRTFYSRRIPEITFGGKVLGKQGPWTLSLIGARSNPATDSTQATFSVVRAQRDVGGSSNIALLAANRTLEADNEGSVGLDATLFFTKTLGMTAQVIRSYGPFDSGVWAYFIRPAYDSPTAHFHVRYTHLGSRFADNVNAVGLIRDDDRRELDSAIERTIWFKNAVLEQFVYDSNYNIYWSQTGTLRSWQIDQSVAVEFRNRWNLEIEHTEEFKRFEKDFRNRSTTFDIGYNTREFHSAQVGFEFGRNFDSDFLLWTAKVGYKFTSKLSLEYELERLNLDPDPEQESTWIHVTTANYFFERDLFLKLFFQTNSIIDRKNLQAVFVYRYQQPFGTIQLAYQRGTAEFGQRSDQSDTFFLKVTRVF
jgi:hypothetical protein